MRSMFSHLHSAVPAYGCVCWASLQSWSMRLWIHLGLYWNVSHSWISQLTSSTAKPPDFKTPQQGLCAQSLLPWRIIISAEGQLHPVTEISSTSAGVSEMGIKVPSLFTKWVVDLTTTKACPLWKELFNGQKYLSTGSMEEHSHENYHSKLLQWFPS